MNVYLAEYIGTSLLLLLGAGVVANVVLNQTKGQNSGWIVITFGWAMAVFVGVYTVGKFSGAHLNPAVTLAILLLGKISFSKALGYMIAQLLGAMTGSSLAWLLQKRPFFVPTLPLEIYFPTCFQRF